MSVKKMTSRLASGRIAFGLLSTCGVKGFAAALINDFAVGLSNTATYLSWSSGITGALGVFVAIYWLQLLHDQEKAVLDASKPPVDRDTCVHEFDSMYRLEYCKKCGMSNGAPRR